MVRLPRVRFPGETEYPSQHPFDPSYVVRLPEASINKQGSVSSPLGPIVCIPRRTGMQQASSDRIAEIVLFFSFFSAVEIFSDVPLTQEQQQNYTGAPTPPLHVSESIVESSLGSNSAISKSTVDMSNIGNAPVHSTHSATTIPTPASPLPKLPQQQMIGRHMCRDWWNGRCYRNPCRFLHPETLPPQTQGYNIVRYSKPFSPYCPDYS